MNRPVAVLLAVIAALALAPAQPARAAGRTSDDAVQTLANFPALQRLAKADAKTLRRYLNRVAAAYRQAGYDEIADALPKMDELIALFEKEKDEASDREIRQAKTALRRLSSALAKNDLVALPSTAGETLPNYRLIAEVFVENAEKALKNLREGRNVANTLRQKVGTLVVKNETGNSFTASGTGSFGSGSVTVNGSSSDFGSAAGGTLTLGGTFSATGSLVKVGSGTLTLNGSNTFSGNLILGAGTVTALTSSALGTGTVDITGGTLVLNFSDTFVIFPVGVEIPSDFAGHPSILLGVAATIGEVEYPAGTRIVKPLEPWTLPDGAILLPTPATISAIPTPSPTPAE
jgi:autotransporter-associated beta strand protein